MEADIYPYHLSASARVATAPHHVDLIDKRGSAPEGCSGCVCGGSLGRSSGSGCLGASTRTGACLLRPVRRLLRFC